MVATSTSVKVSVIRQQIKKSPRKILALFLASLNLRLKTAGKLLRTIAFKPELGALPRENFASFRL